MSYPSDNFNGVLPTCRPTPRAVDTAGAAPGLGAIYSAKRTGLLANRQPATFSGFWRPSAPGNLQVGRTRIAWHLPRTGVLYPSHARQRRS